MFMMKNKLFEIRRATEDNRDEIVECFNRWFYPRNPLLNYLGLVNDGQLICKEYEDFTMKCMEKPHWNFVAFHEGKIVAVCLNKKITKANYASQKSDNINDEKFALFSNFWQQIEHASNLFEKFPDINEAFLMQAGVINENFKGYGLSYEFVLKSLILAEQLGFKLVIAECVNVYAANVMKKIGFNLVYSCKYKNFKNSKGEIIRTIPPHDRVEIFAIRIKNYKL